MSEAAQTSGPLDHLEALVAGQPDLSRRVETLIIGLSAAIKTSSNDQNVQRLSRELRAAAARLSAAVTETA